MVKSKTQSTEEKILESPDALREKLFQSEDFFVKNRNIILGVIGALILIIGGVIGYNFLQSKKNQDAQKEMYASVLYFEADSLDKALTGDLKNPGLLTIAEEYSGTKAGNLANFYIGTIYLKQGKFEEAIKALDEFEADDLLLQGRAYSLTGDAYMELKNYEKALEFYNKAASYKPNEQFTPQYLMKSALAAELKGDYQAAIKAYDEIIKEYPRAQQLNDAKKYKSRAVALANKN